VAKPGERAGMTAVEWENSLGERGWAVIDLPDPAPVACTRAWLLAQLRESFPRLARLEDYHQSAASDAAHFTLLDAIAQRFWTKQFSREIVTANLDLFRALIGPDLHVQNYPYLRVVRPGRSEDAVPLHRDTYYGASPYEVSVVVPFTDMTAASALRAIPGSHTEPDAAYPYVQTQNAQVTPGSSRHRLGYTYAPRLLDPALERRAEPMLAHVGQALIFGLSLVHGGGTNASDGTRFSTDIRVVNSFAPVRMSRGVREDYFVPLCSSPISRIAQRYRASNEGLARPKATP
jgi:Phytanoyl-CoA dioxygenase (PhyH)